MEKLIEQVNKFIKENDLDFSGEGSELNGNCTILAGFICYLLAENHLVSSNGIKIINSPLLELSKEATKELERVFDYAWKSNYKHFWKTKEATIQYKF